jgi:hypothetical protein
MPNAVIGFAAVITNATMIAFVGSQIAHTEAPAAVAGIMLRFDVAPLWVYAHTSPLVNLGVG